MRPIPLGGLWGKLRSAWGRELAYLYLLQGFNYLIPLVLVVYLSRTLSQEAFGLFALGQALALYLQFLVEYGFSLTGTREVARNQGNPQRLGEIWAEVVVARSLLLLPAALLATLSALHPLLRGNPGIALGALLYALALALSPSWFLRGLGRAAWAGGLESASRLLALAGTLALVRSPEEAAVPLIIGGASATAVSLGGGLWVGRRFPGARPTWRSAWARLKAGSRILFVHLSTGLSAMVGPWVLGFHAPPREAALLAAADRVVRILWGALDPLSQTLFPRLAADPASGERARLLRKGGAALLGLGLLLAALLEILAPLLVALLLGEGYQEAIPLVRLLAPLLPLGAVANLLAVHHGLASGLDEAVNRAFLLWGLALVCASLTGAYWGGALGVALASLLAHGLLPILLWAFLRKG